MLLTVDCHTVKLSYLHFEVPSEQIVQVKITREDESGLAFHRNLVSQLKRIFGSVMDNESIDEDGCTEIRLLGDTHLEVIDALRMLKYLVVEIPPHRA